MALVSALSLLGLTANAADVPAPEKPSSKSASVPPFQMRLVAPHAEANTEEMILLGVPESEQKLHVQKAAVLDHASLKDVFVGIQGPGAESTITVVFTLDGTERFAQVTRDNIGERLAIVIDGKLYSAPLIREEITGGTAVITGKFSPKKAADLVGKIKQAIKKV